MPGSERVPNVTQHISCLVSSGKSIDIYSTSAPYLAGPSTKMAAFVAVADWWDCDPAGMFVTVHMRPPAGDESVHLRPDALAMQVHLVYADAAVRALRCGQVGVPVAFGRLLVSLGAINIHSADRNDLGDRWAAAVGGYSPPRVEMGSAGQSAVTGAEVLELLNRVDWQAANKRPRG